MDVNPSAILAVDRGQAVKIRTIAKMRSRREGEGRWAWRPPMDKEEALALAGRMNTNPNRRHKKSKFYLAVRLPTYRRYNRDTGLRERVEAYKVVMIQNIPEEA